MKRFGVLAGRASSRRPLVLMAVLAMVSPLGAMFSTQAQATPAISSNVLPAGGVLRTNGYLTSTDGRYRLTMQADGNLVEAITASGRPLWNSGTFGNAGAWLVVQSDGNVVIYPKAGRAIWNTRSNGMGNGSRLELQTDANIVNYSSGNRPVWASATKNDRIAPGEALTAGQSIRSLNGACTLNMQWDGNLVVRNKAGAPLWSSGTQNQPTARAVSQSDGNFVVYRGTTPLWHTHTNHEYAGGTMVVQDNGRLVLVRGALTTWAS